MTRPRAIDVAGPADAAGVFRLLERNHLPLDGLESHLGTTLVARQDGRLSLIHI